MFSFNVLYILKACLKFRKLHSSYIVFKMDRQEGNIYLRIKSGIR
jgi:hypothetical protein